MEHLFAILSHAVEGSSLPALGAAFAWGLCSILLSPCHLASIPLIVGLIGGGQDHPSVRRALVMALLFAVGILITIAVIGAATASAGRMMGDIGRWGNYAVAGLFFLMGLALLRVIRLPFSGTTHTGATRKGVLAAFVAGLVFGAALGPCTFAFLAPMLGVTFRLSATNPTWGVLLLLAYGVGHCSVIVLAGTCTGLAQRYLDWTDQSNGATMLKRACGVLVMAGGVYLIYTA
jgi:cytochrome c-type biogenesis protein